VKLEKGLESEVADADPPLTGEGSTDREEIDKHLFDPPG